MSVLGDRIMMTIIAGTAAAGLIGWVVGGLIRDITGPYSQFVLPVVLAVVFLVALFVIWEGLDKMD